MKVCAVQVFFLVIYFYISCVWDGILNIGMTEKLFRNLRRAFSRSSRRSLKLSGNLYGCNKVQTVCKDVIKIKYGWNQTI